MEPGNCDACTTAHGVRSQATRLAVAGLRGRGVGEVRMERTSGPCVCSEPTAFPAIGAICKSCVQKIPD